MGLFNFVKDAGEALAKALNLGAPEAPQAVQAAITKHDLGVKDVAVQIEGDKIVLSGTAPTPEAAEKAILAAGNIKGVAAVESKLAVAAAMPEPRFYTVKPGDTLSKISKQFYGDANRYQAIFEANKPMLTHPDKIYPGQALRIPEIPSKTAAA